MKQVSSRTAVSQSLSARALYYGKLVYITAIATDLFFCTNTVQLCHSYCPHFDGTSIFWQLKPSNQHKAELSVVVRLFICITAMPTLS